MITKKTLYVDESGNTGRNFADFNQPIFVYAGWLIHDKYTHEIEKIIINHLELNKIKDEPKGNVILEHEESQEVVRDLFKRLIEIGCVPFYALAEKRFCIAAKIVDVFFDPEFNSCVSNKLYGDKNSFLAQEFARWFRDDLLVDFFRLYDANDYEGLIRFSPRLEKVIDAHVPELFKYMKTVDMRCLCNDYAKEMKSPRMSSLNLPIFFALIKMLGEYAEVKQIVADITVDESSLLRKEVDRLLKESIEPLRCLNRLQQAHSHENPLLVAADLLANSLYRVTISVYCDQPIAPLLIDIASSVFSGYTSNPKTGRFLISFDLLGKLNSVLSA